MYFDVYVNGKRIGTFGHAQVENLSVSVSGAKDGHYLFAGVVCREDGKQFHYSWPQVELTESDEIRIVSSDGRALTKPDRRYEMGRTARKAWEDKVCEFCQRNEAEVEKLIAGDRNRPGICAECVELCNAILRDDA